MAHRIVRLRDIAALVIGYPLLAHFTIEPAHDDYLDALMATAGYWVRRWVLPNMPRARILDAVLALRNTSAPPRWFLQS
ncbi:MAG: hypothetical protein ACYDBW_05280 [Sulfuricaulis sp.]